MSAASPASPTGSNPLVDTSNLEFGRMPDARPPVASAGLPPEVDNVRRSMRHIPRDLTAGADRRPPTASPSFVNQMGSRRPASEAAPVGDKDGSCSINYLYACIGLAALAVVTAAVAAVVFFVTALPIAVTIGLATVAALSAGGAGFAGYKQFIADKA